MAAVTPINTSAYGFTTPAGPKTAPTMSGGAADIRGCYFACGWTGTYVQGTGFSLNLATDIAAAISSCIREGKTITVLSAASADAGDEGATQAFVMPVNLSQIVLGSSTVVTGLLFGPDLATEHAAAAMGTFGTPTTFYVTFAAQ